jgi:hypothetical protein
MDKVQKPSKLEDQQLRANKSSYLVSDSGP